MLSVDGQKRVIEHDDIIVSRTSPKGHLTCTNDIFLDIADFRATKVPGKPHSIVRNNAGDRNCSA